MNTMNNRPGETGDRRQETDRKDPQERRDQTTAGQQSGGFDQSKDRSEGRSEGLGQTDRSQTGTQTR